MLEESSSLKNSLGLHQNNGQLLPFYIHHEKPPLNKVLSYY